jgi:hypothetical protein
MRYGSTSALRDRASVVAAIADRLDTHVSTFVGIAAQTTQMGTGSLSIELSVSLERLASSYGNARDEARTISGWLLSTADTIDALNSEAVWLEEDLAQSGILETFLSNAQWKLDRLDREADSARARLAAQLRDSVRNEVDLTKAETTHGFMYYFVTGLPGAAVTSVKDFGSGVVDGFLSIPKIAVGAYERSAINYFIDRDEFNSKWAETEATVAALNSERQRQGNAGFVFSIGKEMISNPAELGGNIVGGALFGGVLSAAAKGGTAATVASGSADDVLRAAGGTTDELVAAATSSTDDVARGASEAANRAVARPFGTGKPPHSAIVTVTTQNGSRQLRLASGNMTPEEAALGFPRSTLATHTEARAVRQVQLQAGDRMIIQGKYPPCPSCKGAMNKSAIESGAEIVYTWPAGTWRAN